MLQKKKKDTFSDLCAESYLLIKRGVESGASVSIMQNLEAEGFLTYLMQSNQEAEVALESSFIFQCEHTEKLSWGVSIICGTDLTLVHAKCTLRSILFWGHP